MMKKSFLPESFNFDVPPVEIIGVGSKGLDKTAMVKRASAFDDVIEKLEKKANRTYLHVITTGAYEQYGPNLNCFPAGTLVTTLDGLKPIEEVSVFDFVMADDGRFYQVRRTMSRSYTGKMVSIKAIGMPKRIQVTANHPIKFVSKKYKTYRDYRRHTKRDTLEEYQEALTRAAESEDVFIDAEFLEKGDSLIVPIRKTLHNVDDLTNFDGAMKHAKSVQIAITDPLYAYIVGLWLAEGCVELGKKDPNDRKTKYHANSTTGEYAHGSVIFTLNPEHDKESIEALNEFVARAGLSMCVCNYPERHVANYCITSLSLALRFTELCGRGAADKHIHSVLFGMSEEWKYQFLAGYLDGDGCHMDCVNSPVNASTASLELALDLQAMLATLGIPASIATCYNRAKNGCFTRHGEDSAIYSLSVCASQIKNLLQFCRRLEKREKNIPDKEFAGKVINLPNYTLVPITDIQVYEQTEPITVYNLEVAERHTYCVPFAVHNCDGWNGESFELQFPHPENMTKTAMMLDGGLSKYHDDTYMKDGAVYQEHQTKSAGVDPSGEVVAAKYNKLMKRGELLIAVDTEKWAPRLQKKAKGDNIYLSIGASVPRDVCVICGHIAKTANEHCSHFKHHRGELYDCGVRSCVMNDSPDFYDISGVNTPADKIAFVLQEVGGEKDSLKKSASLHDALVAARLATPTRPPMVLTKSAQLLHKLSRMEKQIEGIIEGDKKLDTDAFKDSDEAKKDFLLRVENFPAEEIIDGSSRKGILLTPEMLFKILGKESDDEDSVLKSCDDECCGDMSCMMRELEDDEDVNEELLDGSFDSHPPVDLNLDAILEKFIPEFGMTDPAINGKSIRITIIGVAPKKSTVEKKASFNKMAQEALRRTYARYLISFAAQNDDSTCMNALMKLATIGK